VQRLRALADDVADPLAGGEVIRHSDVKHLNRGHTANVRYLWRLTFSVLALAISKCEKKINYLLTEMVKVTQLWRTLVASSP